MHKFLDGTLSGGVKQEGIDHYNNLIDELVKNGEKLCIFKSKYLNYLYLHVCFSYIFCSKCRHQALCDNYAQWLATSPARQVRRPLESLVHVCIFLNCFTSLSFLLPVRYHCNLSTVFQWWFQGLLWNLLQKLWRQSEKLDYNQWAINSGSFWIWVWHSTAIKVFPSSRKIMSSRRKLIHRTLHSKP